MNRSVHGFTPVVEAKVVAPRIHVQSLLAQLSAPESIAYHNGPLIRNVETTGVFIGSEWLQTPLNEAPAQIEEFLTAYVSSPAISSLSEYSQGSWIIGAGTNNPKVILGASRVGNSINDSDIQKILLQALSAGQLPAVNPNSLYVVFLPDGTTVTAPGVGSSCAENCGYHFNVNGTPYAVLPYPSCAGCLPATLSIWQALTSTTSHEICEAITNPLDSGWFRDSDHSEVGDLCAWQTKIVAGYTVQQIWSINHGGCA